MGNFEIRQDGLTMNYLHLDDLVIYISTKTWKHKSSSSWEELAGKHKMAEKIGLFSENSLNKGINDYTTSQSQ